MESSRDSSIWRSLAVAFGDGLAFGVGMKLTQNAKRQPAELPTADDTIARRLEEMEKRLMRAERAPVALPAASGAVQAQFDQKVLEAVVNALEARLKEQTGHMERRLAELEAKIAIEIKALDRRDQAIDARVASLGQELTADLPKTVQQLEATLDERTSVLHHVERRVNELDDRFASFRGELMEALPKVVDERGRVLIGQVEALVNQAEDRMVTMHHELAAGVEARGSELSAKVSERAAATVDAVVEPKLASLRATLEERNREIADLRNQLEESDRRTLELLNAIGRTCQDAASRIGPPPPAAAVRVEGTPTAPASETPAAAQPSDAPSVPGFAQPKPPGRILQLPFVSSMLVSLGLAGLVLLRII
jgi:CII-binding regulator of phage lambda lysogenization HflD